MFKIFYEDLQVGDSHEFGAYEVTKEEVIDFASKYDPQPFHLDEDFAKQSVFGALCASGWHTCAMMMSMLVKDMMARGMAGAGSPGIDQIRWKKPCFPGDVLSVTTEVVEKRESASRANLGLAKNAMTVKNQNGEVIMTLLSNYMILKRPS